MVITTQSTKLQDNDLSTFLIWLKRGKEKCEQSNQKTQRNKRALWNKSPETLLTYFTYLESVTCPSDLGLKYLLGQIEKSGRTNTQKQRGASAVLKGFFFCFSITSKGILLFCPVSLNACARRKTSSTPTPRARNGKTCSEDTAQ